MNNNYNIIKVELGGKEEEEYKKERVGISGDH